MQSESAAGKALEQSPLEVAYRPAAATGPKRVVFHDRIWPQPLQSGDVVLAVGLDCSDATAADLVRGAALAGAAAVVLRAEVVPAWLRRVAESSGICLVRAPLSAGWEQIEAIVSGGVPGSGGNEAEDDPGPLLEALARLVEADVALLGPELELVAYAGAAGASAGPYTDAVITRRLPPDWVRRLESPIARTLASGDVVVALGEDLGPPPCCLVGVRRESGQHDLILAQFPPWSLTTEKEEVLSRAAAAMARRPSRSSALDKLDAEPLHALLEGRSADRLAEGIGLAPADRCVVLALRPLPRDRLVARSAIHRASGIVRATVQALHPAAAHVETSRVIYILMWGSSLSPESALAFATRLRWEVEKALGGRALVGVGGLFDGLHADAAQTSRREADLVLEVLEKRDLSRAATLRMVSGLALLDELCEMLRADSGLQRGPLADGLLDADAKRTLRGYLDAFGDATKAAASLHMHPNTLRYRLRRIVGATQLDLTCPRIRAILGLQLRAHPPA